jgi:uncharacterized membrane protein (UPF0127 family)
MGTPLARRCGVRGKYASRPASRAALHLDLFEQPTENGILSMLLLRTSWRLGWLCVLVGCLLLGAGHLFAAAVEVNPPLPTGRVVLSGRVTVIAELARNPQEKGRGLSGRPGLASGQGMLFVYEAPQPIGIWMKDMRFSLDILWVQQGRIVRIVANAPPLTPGGPETVYTATGDLVLEVPAGFTTKHGIRVGDSAKVVLH